MISRYLRLCIKAFYNYSHSGLICRILSVRLPRLPRSQWAIEDFPIRKLKMNYLNFKFSRDLPDRVPHQSPLIDELQRRISGWAKIVFCWKFIDFLRLWRRGCRTYGLKTPRHQNSSPPASGPKSPEIHRRTIGGTPLVGCCTSSYLASGIYQKLT